MNIRNPGFVSVIKGDMTNVIDINFSINYNQSQHDKRQAQNQGLHSVIRFFSRQGVSGFYTVVKNKEEIC